MDSREAITTCYNTLDRIHGYICLSRFQYVAKVGIIFFYIFVDDFVPGKENNCNPCHIGIFFDNFRHQQFSFSLKQNFLGVVVVSLSTGTWGVSTLLEFSSVVLFSFLYLFYEDRNYCV